MNDNDIIKAFDILDKFEFFDGQRAGRELWFDKPADIQEKDIADFNRDIDFLKAFINRREAEIERLKAMIEAAEDHYHPLPFKGIFDEKITEAKSEAIKEFAERLRNKFFNYYDGLTESTSKSNHNGDSLMFYEVANMIEDCIDSLVEEMTEGEDA